MPYLPGMGQIGLGLFGGGQNAMRHLNDLPGMIGGYLDPYVKGGQDMFGRFGQESSALTGLRGPLQQQIMQMLQNPSAMLHGLGAGYKQSPGYQFQLGEAQKAANQAAAAGGMAGSPMHQQQAADVAQNMASKDYNNYLQQVLGLHGQGMGAGQNMYGMGFQGLGQGAQMGLQAGSNMANLIAQNQNNKASLDFMRDQMKRQGIMGGLGSLLGGHFMNKLF